MAGVVQPLPASRRLQPQYREERRKKWEEYLSRKPSMSTPSQPNQKPHTQPSVTETAKKDPLQRRTQVLKPFVQKMANKENKDVKIVAKKIEDLILGDSSQITDSRIKEPATSTLLKENQGKEGPSMTFTRTFLKTKALKEKQLKDEKLKAESSKEVSAKPAKPMLGVYRGKVIQSRINSFRSAPPCTTQKGQAEEDKLGSKAHVATTKPSSAPVRQVSKPMPTSGMELRRPFTSKGTTQVRPSISAHQSKIEPAAASKRTNSLAHGASSGRTVPQRPDPCNNLKKGPLTQQTKAVSRKDQTSAVKPAVSLPPQNKSTQPRTGGKTITRPTETAEETKARLAEWRASKGKVMKRPPRSAAMASTYKVIKEVAEVKNEPVMKSEPEPPRTIEKPRQLFWTTMAEEDEQALLTQKVQHVFEECQKLINEDCPKEDVLAILENQIQSLPEAKKIPKYWVCLARLEQREGQLEKVFAVCEEAASAGVQPLDELRCILAEAVENLKDANSDTGKDVSHEGNPKEPCKAEESEHQIKSEPVEQDGSWTRGKGKQRKTVKLEPEEETLEKKPTALLETPKHKDNTSVIRFNVRSTPHLDKMKTRIQMDECDSAFKDFKYVTPVRRSQRIERKAHNLPNMLKDHDPCVSGIAQLADLDSCPSAYIFRKNQALA